MNEYDKENLTDLVKSMSNVELKDFYFTYVVESANIIVSETLSHFLDYSYIPKLRELAECQQAKVSFLEQICKERGVQLFDN